MLKVCYKCKQMNIMGSPPYLQDDVITILGYFDYNLKIDKLLASDN